MIFGLKPVSSEPGWNEHRPERQANGHETFLISMEMRPPVPGGGPSLPSFPPFGSRSLPFGLCRALAQPAACCFGTRGRDVSASIVGDAPQAPFCMVPRRANPPERLWLRAEKGQHQPRRPSSWRCHRGCNAPTASPAAGPSFSGKSHSWSSVGQPAMTLAEAE